MNKSIDSNTTTQSKKLNLLHQNLEQCQLCPSMFGPPVHGLAVLSPVMLIGQAPGFKEIEVLKPFAWTAGKKLFSWFNGIGINEQQFRSKVYMSAICRCYPGKKVNSSKTAASTKTKAHGDRVPEPLEIEQCAQWLSAEIELIKPQLIILVGKLAISQFMTIKKLDEVIGQKHPLTINDHHCEAIPLPHPSGASTWPLKEPGKTLLQQALTLIEQHPAWISLK